MIYDTNQYGGTPRDRLDPRLFAEGVPQNRARRAVPACACGENLSPREAATPRMENPEDDACASGVGGAMPALAMVYSPKQGFQNIYGEEDALARGTIFAELDKPFYGAACTGGGCNG